MVLNTFILVSYNVFDYPNALVLRLATPEARNLLETDLQDHEIHQNPIREPWFEKLDTVEL